MKAEKPQAPAQGKPDPSKAVFKLVVYFKNGSKRTLYNYHTAWNAETKKIIEDEKVGLAKLERLLLFKYREAYTTALVYHIPTGKQIKKYCYDRLIQESAYTWYYDAPANAIRFRLTN
jgi:hypothetical protein